MHLHNILSTVGLCLMQLCACQDIISQLPETERRLALHIDSPSISVTSEHQNIEWVFFQQRYTREWRECFRLWFRKHDLASASALRLSLCNRDHKCASLLHVQFTAFIALDWIDLSPSSPREPPENNGQYTIHEHVQRHLPLLARAHRCPDRCEVHSSSGPIPDLGSHRMERATDRCPSK